MKIFTSSGVGVWWHAEFVKEKFEIVSVDSKIIEVYGSVENFLKKVFLGKVPFELQKPNDIHLIYSGEKLKNGSGSLVVFYNARKINIQMITDFCKKIGVGILPFPGTSLDEDWGKYPKYEEEDRAKREALFESPAKSEEVVLSEQITFSLFQVITEKFKSRAAMSSLEEKFDKDRSANYALYHKEGMSRFGTWDWDNFRISAVYSESKCSEEFCIKYLEEKFGLEVTSELD